MTGYYSLWFRLSLLFIRLLRGVRFFRLVCLYLGRRFRFVLRPRARDAAVLKPIPQETALTVGADQILAGIHFGILVFGQRRSKDKMIKTPSKSPSEST